MQQEKCREPHHVSPCSRNFKGLHLNKYGVQFQGFPLCILPFIYNVYEARPTGPATGSKWTTLGLLNYEGKIITITIILVNIEITIIQVVILWLTTQRYHCGCIPPDGPVSLSLAHQALVLLWHQAGALRLDGQTQPGAAGPAHVDPHTGPQPAPGGLDQQQQPEGEPAVALPWGGGGPAGRQHNNHSSVCWSRRWWGVSRRGVLRQPLAVAKRIRPLLRC